MDTPDALPRHHGSDTPVLIALTEDERLHPLDCFADESPQEAPPEVRGALPAPPAPAVQLEILSSEMRQALRWAAVLTAIVVVYIATTLVLMRITAADITIATLNDRMAEASEAAPPMPETVPETVAVAEVPASAAVVAMASSTADEPKAREAVATRESRREAPPARLDPPIQRVDPPIQRVSVSSPGTAEPLPILEPPIAPLLASPPPPASLRVEASPVVEVPATLPRAEASAAPVLPRVPPPEAAIQTVLSRYRSAYRELDAGAARAIWPSVDTKALGKAFERLERQDLTFDSCQIAIIDVRAVASCHGVASYVPRVGKKGVRDDPRRWEFKLSKVDDTWQIETVSTR